MNKRKYGFILAALIVAYTMVGTAVNKVFTIHSVQAQQSKIIKRRGAPQYEARVVNSATAQGLADEANKLGEQGWELVSVIIDDGKGYAFPYTAYLKRVRP